MNYQINNATILSIEAIKNLLQSNNIADIKEGLKQFWLYVEQNSSGNTNATYSFFDLDKKKFEYKLLEVPILKSLLIKFADQLDTTSLLYLVHAGMFCTIYDNFKMVLDVANIFIERKDVEGQNGVVKAFHKACINYEGGNRVFANTVQDNLIIKYFPKFEGEPLANLLIDCTDDQLKNNDGDYMAYLFTPAFEKIQDKNLEKKLRNRFSEYITTGLKIAIRKFISNNLFSINYKRRQ